AAFLAREASAHAAGWGFARAAARAAAGGAVPHSVTLLTQGAMNMLLMAKFKGAAVAIVAAGGFLTANAFLFTQGPAASEISAAAPKTASAHAEAPAIPD